jgi:hypothetical protein
MHEEPPMCLAGSPRFVALRLSAALLLTAGLFGVRLLSAAAQTPQAPAFGSGLEICTAPAAPVELVNPIVVSNCTQAGLQAALDTGGHIAFDCGAGAAAIPLASELVLNPNVSTVIDGGGQVTLDGQGQTRILSKGWHDPAAVEDVYITLQNIRLINGRAPAGTSTGEHSGGALAAGHPGTHVYLINSTFENNQTTEKYIPDNQGGAVFVHNAYETVISGSVFRGNQAGNGGAFGGIATGLIIVNSRFEDNQATDATDDQEIVRGYGGAVHLDGVTNSYNPDSRHQVYVCGSVFQNNLAVRGGGALSVVVSDNKGTLATYQQSSFIDNQAIGTSSGDFGNGGALYHIEDDHDGGRAEYNFEIKDATFQGNQAHRQGGGVWLYILGRGQVLNSTFSANTTTAGFNQVGQGGGMIVHLGVIEIINTLFANNHADYQAGALHAGGASDPDRVVTLTNTIFADNTLNYGQTQPSETRWQGYHTNRPMADGGSNIQYPQYKPVYDNDVNNWITANPIFLEPKLGILGAYGGPTETIPLLAGSPAIDAGKIEACPGLDQRGASRSGRCDIGPFEFEGTFVIPTEWTYLPLLRR